MQNYKKIFKYSKYLNMGNSWRVTKDKIFKSGNNLQLQEYCKRHTDYKNVTSIRLQLHLTAALISYSS